LEVVGAVKTKFRKERRWRGFIVLLVRKECVYNNGCKSCQSYITLCGVEVNFLKTVGGESRAS
jgi:hypothetical protein